MIKIIKKPAIGTLIILFIILGIIFMIPKFINAPSTKKIPSYSKKTPAKILNLSNWKLTVPKGTDENPEEIKQPKLDTYETTHWFVTNKTGDGVQFRAPVNGETTKGSDYPRSELREMIKNGTANAGWSSTSGTHTMYLDEAITAVPKAKPHVVTGQIHDASDDVIVIRLEYPNLYVNVDGDNIYLLDGNYTLGKRFTVTFIVNNDQTKVYYNNSSEPVYTLKKKYSNSYFKAGVYTQSNCSKEESGNCNDQNFGEVILYDVRVSHK